MTQPISVNVSGTRPPARRTQDTGVLTITLAGAVGFGIGALVMLAVTMTLDSPNDVAERTAAEAKAAHLAAEQKLTAEIAILRSQLVSQKSDFDRERANFAAWYKNAQSIGEDAAMQLLQSTVLTFPQHVTLGVLTDQLSKAYAVRPVESSIENAKAFDVGDGKVALFIRQSNTRDDSPLTMVMVSALVKNDLDAMALGEVFMRVRKAVTTQHISTEEQAWFESALTSAVASQGSTVSRTFGIVEIRIQSSKDGDAMLWLMLLRPAKKD